MVHLECGASLGPTIQTSAIQTMDTISKRPRDQFDMRVSSLLPNLQ